MPERWVVDASPIISLAKLNKASLMMELCEELLVPSAVAEEINRGPGNDPAKLWLQKSEVLANSHAKKGGSISS